MSAIVFLGGGRITSALVAGLRLARYKQPLLIHDRNASKLRELKRRYGVQGEPDLERAVARAKLLIIAVRPDSVSELLAQIGTLRRPLPAVSLAAGIPLRKLRSKLGAPVRWARAMPSPVCRYRRGLIALAFDRGFPNKPRQQVLSLFTTVGQVLEIAESKFDAFTVTYSSSHGYHALAALAEAGEQLGLDRECALTAAAHALADGVLSWREGHLSLPELLHEAATPGGIAGTTMAATDRAGYQRALQRGLRAGFMRAQKNAGFLE